MILKDETDGQKIMIKRIDSWLAVLFISFTSVLMSLGSVWAEGAGFFLLVDLVKMCWVILSDAGKRDIKLSERKKDGDGEREAHPSALSLLC